MKLQQPSLDCQCHPVSWDQLPAHDAGGLFRALADGHLQSAGFPLFDPASPPAERSIGRTDWLSAVEDYNRQYDNPMSDQFRSALAGAGAMVIAGQQPGLLGGPMYSLLKTITAIRLAEVLTDRHGLTVVPCFWIASEDHDILEVNRCTLNGKQLVLDHVEATASHRPPVGDIGLGPYRQQVLAFAAQALGGLRYADKALDLIGSLDWSNYASAMACLWVELFGAGRLVLIDPQILRTATGPILAGAVEQMDAVQSAIAEGGGLLKDYGIDPPLDHATLFAVIDGCRQAVRFEDHQFVWGQQRLAPQRMAEFIRRQPEIFSPSAALRPVVQDAVLPVLATVGGPSELAYLWQIDPVYRLLGVRRSRLYPRFSATLVNVPVRRKADKLGLSAGGVLQVLKALADHQSQAPQALAGTDRVLSLQDQLLALLDQVGADAEKNIRSKARDSIRYQVHRVLKRAGEKQLEAHGVGRRALEQIAEMVMPQQAPQERIMTAVEAVARFGPGVVDILSAAFSPSDMQHVVIDLDRRVEQE